MKHCKWKYPDEEDDFDIHFRFDTEMTLCNLYFEGSINGQSMTQSKNKNNQDFVNTKSPVTCPKCIEIVTACQKVNLQKNKSK